MTNLDSILKSRNITLPTKVRLAKAMVFSVVMYGCESWTIKKAECRRIDAFELWCWRRFLSIPWTARRSNQSILKEISPGCSLEGLMLKLKLPLATWCEELTHWKRPWCWEGLGEGGEGDNRGWDGWMASPTRWTWVWVNSGSCWWKGRPGVLRFMGSQRVGHNWVTELNWWLSWWGIRLQCGRPGFGPWIGKIPWRRERLPTPGFWPGESRGLYRPWGCKESDTPEKLSLPSTSPWTSPPPLGLPLCAAGMALTYRLLLLPVCSLTSPCDSKLRGSKGGSLLILHVSYPIWCIIHQISVVIFEKIWTLNKCLINIWKKSCNLKILIFCFYRKYKNVSMV